MWHESLAHVIRWIGFNYFSRIPHIQSWLVANIIWAFNNNPDKVFFQLLSPMVQGIHLLKLKLANFVIFFEFVKFGFKQSNQEKFDLVVKIGHMKSKYGTIGWNIFDDWGKVITILCMELIEDVFN